jgi:hypothetical protein
MTFAADALAGRSAPATGGGVLTGRITEDNGGQFTPWRAAGPRPPVTAA